MYEFCFCSESPVCSAMFLVEQQEIPLYTQRILWHLSSIWCSRHLPVWVWSTSKSRCREWFQVSVDHNIYFSIFSQKTLCLVGVLIFDQIWPKFSGQSGCIPTENTPLYRKHPPWFREPDLEIYEIWTVTCNTARRRREILSFLRS